MKVFVDEALVFETNETQDKILKNHIPSNIFLEDMQRRIGWYVGHVVEECANELEKQYLTDLTQAHAMVPTDQTERAKLILELPVYKDCQTRIDEADAVANQRLAEIAEKARTDNEGK